MTILHLADRQIVFLDRNGASVNSLYCIHRDRPCRRCYLNPEVSEMRNLGTNQQQLAWMNLPFWDLDSAFRLITTFSSFHDLQDRAHMLASAPASRLF